MVKIVLERDNIIIHLLGIININIWAFYNWEKREIKYIFFLCYDQLLNYKEYKRIIFIWCYFLFNLVALIFYV